MTAATARIAAELVDLRTGMTIWAGDATTTSNVETSNISSVVAAMSRALQMNIDRLVTEMEVQLPGSDVSSRVNP